MRMSPQMRQFGSQRYQEMQQRIMNARHEGFEDGVKWANMADDGMFSFNNDMATEARAEADGYRAAGNTVMAKISEAKASLLDALDYLIPFDALGKAIGSLMGGRSEFSDRSMVESRMLPPSMARGRRGMYPADLAAPRSQRGVNMGYNRFSGMDRMMGSRFPGYSPAATGYAGAYATQGASTGFQNFDSSVNSSVTASQQMQGGSFSSNIMDAATTTAGNLHSVQQDLQNLDPESPTYQADLLKMQNKMQQLQQMFSMITNIMKTLHEIAKEVIRNFRA